MPHPHWKSAVMTPKAAATQTRLVAAACSGTASERKASSSTIMLSTSTTAMTSGSLSVIAEARSTLPAVEPPT